MQIPIRRIKLLTVISHRQSSALHLRKRHTACLLQTPHTQTILHLRLARKAIDNLILGARKGNRADLAIVGVEDVDLRVPRRGDGVAGGEVGAEGAAVGIWRDEEGGVGVAFVGRAGGLGDGVVYGEAEGGGVGDLAGAGGEVGGGGWGGGGEAEGGEEEGG